MPCIPLCPAALYSLQENHVNSPDTSRMQKLLPGGCDYGEKLEALSFLSLFRIWGQGCPQKAPASHGWRIRRRSGRSQHTWHRKLRASCFSESEHPPGKSFCIRRAANSHPPTAVKSASFHSGVRRIHIFLPTAIKSASFHSGVRRIHTFLPPLPEKGTPPSSIPFSHKKTTLSLPLTFHPHNTFART